MPKLRKTATEEFNDYMRAVMMNIVCQCKIRGFDRQKQAKINGWSLSTYYNRLRAPQELKLDELYNFSKFLRIPMSELLNDPMKKGAKNNGSYY